MIIFGHRGAPGFPRYGENTIRSFRDALEAGATGLEMDVRRCKDGTIVVIHDHTVDRTTNGRGRVRDFSYDQLQQLDAGRGDTIPRLDAVLDEFGGRCLLNIELKEPGLISDIRRLIQNRHLETNVIVSAFDIDDNHAEETSWQELGEIASVIPVAPLISRSKLSRMGAKAFVHRAIELEARAVHPQGCMEIASLVPIAHQAGLRVHVWTVNDARDIATLRELGVDGVFTDFPERGVTA